MDFYNLTPKVVEKRKWILKYVVRKSMQKRFNAILKYTGYTVEDLAFILDTPEEKVEKYFQDCTKIPIDDLLLLARLCNVRIDCFSNMDNELNWEIFKE